MNTTTIKERFILMSAPMVKASLKDVDPKTQTRRIMKPQPDAGFVRSGTAYRHPKKMGPYLGELEVVPCPYGKPGDRLRVKEHAWMWCEQRPNGVTKTGRQKFLHVPLREAQVFYCADHPQKPALDVVSPSTGNAWGWRKKLGRFLPAWASRLTFQIAAVRVERLQDISEADAIAEGIAPYTDNGVTTYKNYLTHEMGGLSAVESYRTLWESINGVSSWALNPWVWVVEFKRVK